MHGSVSSSGLGHDEACSRPQPAPALPVPGAVLLRRRARVLEEVSPGPLGVGGAGLSFRRGWRPGVEVAARQVL